MPTFNIYLQQNTRKNTALKKYNNKRLWPRHMTRFGDLHAVCVIDRTKLPYRTYLAGIYRAKRSEDREWGLGKDSAN